MLKFEYEVLPKEDGFTYVVFLAEELGLPRYDVSKGAVYESFIIAEGFALEKIKELEKADRMYDKIAKEPK